MESRPRLGDMLAVPALVVVACLAVAIGAFGHMPYGYYTFLRIAVCFAAFGLVAAIPSGPWSSMLRTVLVGCIILYNPFIPVYLSRPLPRRVIGA